jgi:hypothetical protein
MLVKLVFCGPKFIDYLKEHCMAVQFEVFLQTFYCTYRFFSGFASNDYEKLDYKQLTI